MGDSYNTSMHEIHAIRHHTSNHIVNPSPYKQSHRQSVTIQAITSSIRHRTSNHIVNPSPYKQSHRQSVAARSPSSIRHHTGNHIVNPSPYKLSPQYASSICHPI